MKLGAPQATTANPAHAKGMKIGCAERSEGIRGKINPEASRAKHTTRAGRRRSLVRIGTGHGATSSPVQDSKQEQKNPRRTSTTLWEQQPRSRSVARLDNNNISTKKGGVC